MGTKLVGGNVGILVGFLVGKDVGSFGVVDGESVITLLVAALDLEGLYVGGRLVGVNVGTNVHPNSSSMTIDPSPEP